MNRQRGTTRRNLKRENNKAFAWRHNENKNWWSSKTTPSPCFAASYISSSHLPYRVAIPTPSAQTHAPRGAQEQLKGKKGRPSANHTAAAAAVVVASSSPFWLPDLAHPLDTSSRTLPQRLGRGEERDGGRGHRPADEAGQLHRSGTPCRHSSPTRPRKAASAAAHGGHPLPPTRQLVSRFRWGVPPRPWHRGAPRIREEPQQVPGSRGKVAVPRRRPHGRGPSPCTTATRAGRRGLFSWLGRRVPVELRRG